MPFLGSEQALTFNHINGLDLLRPYTNPVPDRTVRETGRFGHSCGYSVAVIANVGAY